MIGYKPLDAGQVVPAGASHLDQKQIIHGPQEQDNNNRTTARTRTSLLLVVSVY